MVVEEERRTSLMYSSSIDEMEFCGDRRLALAEFS
jgi:hypothetical protein